MDAVLTEEQTALAEAVRALAADGLTGARAMLDGGDLPAQPTSELFDGFDGIGLPESAGGLGGGLIDLALVARELGRTVTPTPWLSHQLALHVAASVGLDVTDALNGQRWTLSDSGGSMVRDGDTADAVVVVDGDTVTLAPVTGRSPRSALDPSRPIADVQLGEPAGSVGGGGRSALDGARAVVAAGLTGVGHGAVTGAVGYANEREQFGKVIGVFQGVSHQLAEAWTHVELAWSLVLHACWATGQAHTDAATAVDAAVAKAGNATIAATERAMQVHGGIGITWEADPHLWLRRAMADDAWLGGAREAELSLGAAVLTSSS